MKKAILFLIAFLSVLALMFTSCNNEASFDTEGTLVVSISGGQSRGLLPSASMEIAKYDLTVNDASGKKVATATLGKTSTGMSFSMPAGTYSVFVEAKNSDGVMIGQGSVEATVTAGKTNAVTVIITECAGNGTFAVTINANDGYGLELKIYNLSGDKIYSKMLKYQDGKFVTDGTVSLANGFYRFEMVRTDTNAVIKGSSLRIMKDVATTYEATFSFLSDGSMAIVNEILNIPAIEITLTKNTVNQSENLEATATISGIENYTTCWFIDGNALGTFGAYSDLSQDISTLSPGTHELELYVKNSQIMWSEYKTFTVEAISLLFPAFANEEYSSGSRGLTSETIGSIEFFGGNPRLGAAILQLTPLVPSLKSVSGVNVALGILPSSVTVDFNVYGFIVRYVEHSFAATGVYVRYNLLSNGEIVGDIDYYYDWVSNSFSLRQKVILNMQGMIYGVLVLEMRDIHVEKTIMGALSGNYKCGQYNSSEGTLEKNAWIDVIHLYDPADDACSGGYHYQRYYLTINSSDGVISSVLQPWNQESYAKTESSGITELLPEGYDCFDDFVLANQEGSFSTIASYMDYNYMKKVLNHFFSAESLLQGSEKKKFRNNSPGLSLKEQFATNVTRGGMFVGPTIYTTSERNKFGLAAKVGASNLMGSGLEMMYHMANNLSDAKTQYDDTMNFKAFYDTVEDCKTREEIAEYILDKHLRQCGITNDNFIANFIAEETYYSSTGINKYLVPVTGISPEEFQVLLYDAYNN